MLHAVKRYRMAICGGLLKDLTPPGFAAVNCKESRAGACDAQDVQQSRSHLRMRAVIKGQINSAAGRIPAKDRVGVYRPHQEAGVFPGQHAS